jgi:hypothetical protein
MMNSQATDGVKKLVQVFVDKGYALKCGTSTILSKPTRRQIKSELYCLKPTGNYGRQLFVLHVTVDQIIIISLIILITSL